MDRGWVKLHRKIDENHFLMHDDNAYLLFTKLLIFVNSNGEYAVGRRVLADRANMNPSTIYGVLIRLEREGLIVIESKKKYSVIRIANWGKYQAYNRPPNRLITDDKRKSPTAYPTITQPQHNHNSTTAQHLYKNKNKNKNKNRDLSFEKPGQPKVSQEKINNIREQLKQKGLKFKAKGV